MITINKIIWLKTRMVTNTITNKIIINITKEIIANKIIIKGMGINNSSKIITKDLIQTTRKIMIIGTNTLKIQTINISEPTITKTIKIINKLANT